MRLLVPSKLPEWTDFSNEADFGNVLLELFAYMGDILSYYQDRVANESFLGTAQTRRSIIQHLRLIGYKLGTAVPAGAGLFVTVPGSVNAAVTLNRGDAICHQEPEEQAERAFRIQQPIAAHHRFQHDRSRSRQRQKEYTAAPRRPIPLQER
ncbi:MAG: hypothetical protein WDO73_04465 [Ignavibacteriota bacterium]